jgi:signal transduction histidine kinase
MIEAVHHTDEIAVLRRDHDALAAADRRKDEFLAMLAHELRTPLVPLRHALQLLALSREDPQAVEQTRAMMIRHVERLVRLMDELHDFRRVTLGRTDLERRRLSLTDLLRRAVEDVWPLVDSARHSLIVSLPDEPVWIEGDEMRLTQVVVNLLDNAVRFTPRGGRIELVGGWEDGSAVIRVRDNGIGIPRAMLPRVFELFVKVDRPRKRAKPGFGIGLGICRWLVEMHGGTIEGRSDGADLGSEFVVTLPLARMTPRVRPPAGDEMIPDLPFAPATGLAMAR